MPADPARRSIDRRVTLPIDRDEAACRCRSAADLAADRVLLLIERTLLGAGDVAVTERCHGALLAADRVILLVQAPGLPGRQLAFAVFVIDAPVLVRQPVIDLIAARMVAFPRRLCQRARGREAEDADGGDNDNLGGTVHCESPSDADRDTRDRLTTTRLLPIGSERIVAGTFRGSS